MGLNSYRVPYELFVIAVHVFSTRASSRPLDTDVACHAVDALCFYPTVAGILDSLNDLRGKSPQPDSKFLYTVRANREMYGVNFGLS